MRSLLPGFFFFLGPSERWNRDQQQKQNRLPQNNFIAGAIHHKLLDSSFHSDPIRSCKPASAQNVAVYFISPRQMNQ